MRISTFFICLIFSLKLNAQCSVEIYLNNGDCYYNCSASASALTIGAYPYTYTWSNGETTATVNDLCRDSTYIVTMIDNLGCVANDTMTIPFDTMYFSNSIVNASCPTCCDGADTVLVGAINPPPCDQYLYTWCPPGCATSSPYPYQTGLCTGTYTVVVSTNCGCYYSTLITVGVNTVTSINENSPSDFSFSQTDDNLKISSSDEIKEVEIIDLKGRIVVHSNETIFNIGNLNSGIYFVAVRTSKTRIVKKIFRK